MQKSHFQMEIPGRVAFLDGKGDLPKIEANSAWSNAEVYLHGAQVTHFQKKNEPPVLFLSEMSRFEPGHPIRGGVPIIFPWFGAKEGASTMHGFARIKTWEIKEFAQIADGTLSLRFRFPECAEGDFWPRFTADFIVTLGQTLTMELILANTSADQDFVVENCLHTYFQVGHISDVTVHGLQGARYQDKCENFATKTETAEVIRVTAETDRSYLDTTSTVEIRDARLGRKIVVEKSGSRSTVVWNPWIDRAQQISDFGNDEYQQMVCVESGNIADNKLTLKPGDSSALKVVISTAPL